ncbi:MAG: hypothetical protein ACTHJT_12690 [Cytophaga sp.]|uniref:hypothetical protein n=1 Tax=Cytophaga sp. TaxID=29535 RepID=UPI003F7F0DD1
MKPDEIIEEILSITNPILSKDIEERNNFPVGFTFYHVLERVNFNLESIRVLVKDGITKHEHAIGLLSRNLLSDFITTGYIIRLSKSDEEFYVRLYSLYDSDLKKAKSFLRLYLDAGFIDSAEVEKYNELYNDENNIFKQIRDYCLEFDVKKFPQTNDIINKFFESDLNDLWTEQIKRSYDTWAFLSKYEHLGWHSYDFTRTVDSQVSEIRLNSVLFKTTIMAASCLELLKEKDAMESAVRLNKAIFDFYLKRI